MRPAYVESEVYPDGSNKHAKRADLAEAFKAEVRVLPCCGCADRGGGARFAYLCTSSLPCVDAPALPTSAALPDMCCRTRRWLSTASHPTPAILHPAPHAACAWPAHAVCALLREQVAVVPASRLLAIIGHSLKWQQHLVRGGSCC